MARTLEGVTPDPVAVSSPSWQVDARATLADERHHAWSPPWSASCFDDDEHEQADPADTVGHLAVLRVRVPWILETTASGLNEELM
jgi:hypothetical protein